MWARKLVFFPQSVSFALRLLRRRHRIHCKTFHISVRWREALSFGHWTPKLQCAGSRPWRIDPEPEDRDCCVTAVHRDPIRRSVTQLGFLGYSIRNCKSSYVWYIVECKTLGSVLQLCWPFKFWTQQVLKKLRARPLLGLAVGITVLVVLVHPSIGLIVLLLVHAWNCQTALCRYQLNATLLCCWVFMWFDIKSASIICEYHLIVSMWTE